MWVRGGGDDVPLLPSRAHPQTRLDQPNCQPLKSKRDMWRSAATPGEATVLHALEPPRSAKVIVEVIRTNLGSFNEEVEVRDVSGEWAHPPVSLERARPCHTPRRRHRSESPCMQPPRAAESPAGVSSGGGGGGGAQGARRCASLPRRRSAT